MCLECCLYLTKKSSLLVGFVCCDCSSYTCHVSNAFPFNKYNACVRAFDGLLELSDKK
jgi:hypothetical protein